MHILLIIFFAVGAENMQVEFDNLATCLDAKMKLQEDRINAKLYCVKK